MSEINILLIGLIERNSSRTQTSLPIGTLHTVCVHLFGAGSEGS